MNEAPGWLVAEVAEGIQRLLVLRLDGCPPSDAVEAVALAWADAMMVRSVAWQEDLDAPRIRSAFRHLAAHAMRWPAPAELWLYMPSRPQPAALPPAPAGEEERAKARAVLAGLREKMGIKG